MSRVQELLSVIGPAGVQQELEEPWKALGNRSLCSFGCRSAALLRALRGTLSRWNSLSWEGSAQAVGATSAKSPNVRQMTATSLCKLWPAMTASVDEDNQNAQWSAHATDRIGELATADVSRLLC